MEVYRNEFIVLEQENDCLFLTVLKDGYSTNQFYELMRNFPTLEVTDRNAVLKAFYVAKMKRLEIGIVKPEIELSLPPDKMVATIRINCTEAEFNENKEAFIRKVLAKLHTNHVQYGIIANVLQDELLPNEDIVVAKGKEPVNGKDGIVRYFTLSERKPTIRQDGRADYYDMNFIDEVEKDDWLGEKIPPTEGIPGKTVTGEMVPPKPGKDKKLLYDRKTVYESEEDGKIVLRAKHHGVVTYKDGKLSVGEHLTIDGDVGVETGNIDFEGSITVKGIVQPGFSVSATNDISILGEMGLSGVKMIQSKHGDIFIKGGVFGQGETTVKAGKDIFVKHANNCILIAKRDLHIGYYSIGSFLKARNIKTNEQKGKIIGGRLEAKGKIDVAIFGNKLEKLTMVHVIGFDRQSLEIELNEIETSLQKESKIYEDLRKRIEILENSPLNEREQRQLKQLYEKHDEQLEIVTNLEERCNNIKEVLKIRGEGEIIIRKEAYPGTDIQIKRWRKRLLSKVKGTFFVEENQLKFLPS